MIALLLLLLALGLALLGVVVVIGGAMAEERRRGDGDAWARPGCPLRDRATELPPIIGEK